MEGRGGKGEKEREGGLERGGRMGRGGERGRVGKGKGEGKRGKGRARGAFRQIKIYNYTLPTPLIRAILDYAARYKYHLCICMYAPKLGFSLVWFSLCTC